jgi:hypothetical protein
MDKELISCKSNSTFLAVAYFMQLIGFIARCYTQAEVPEQVDILSLSKVVSYIESNIVKPDVQACRPGKLIVNGTVICSRIRKRFAIRKLLLKAAGKEYSI